MREQRKDERIELTQPVTLDVLTDKGAVVSTQPCKVLDISAKGARIETSSGIASGTRVRLKLSIHTTSGASALTLPGLVKWVRNVAHTSHVRAGIELSKTPSPDIEKWARFAAKKRSVIF